jgi:hypothetical protein
MLPLTVFVKPTRHYVSMRVHGTSVHINRGNPPDSPAKVLNVERLGRGTRVSANWTFEVAAHFSIPTPLEVLDTSIPMSVLTETRSHDVPPHYVFKGTSIWLQEVVFDVDDPSNLIGLLEVWDGGRRVFHTNIQSVPVAPASAYDEDRPPSGVGRRYIIPVERRLYSALGLTLTVGFKEIDPEHNFIEFHAAKAIFLSS